MICFLAAELFSLLFIDKGQVNAEQYKHWLRLPCLDLIEKDLFPRRTGKDFTESLVIYVFLMKEWNRVITKPLENRGKLFELMNRPDL